MRILRRVAARPDRLGSRHEDQPLHAGGDVAGRDAEARFHVVAAERDDDKIERRVAAQAGREIVGAAAVGLDRILEHGGAAIEALLDNRVALAKLAAHHAGPAQVGGNALLRRGIEAPGVGIAESDDDRHEMNSRPGIDEIPRAFRDRIRAGQRAARPPPIIN